MYIEAERGLQYPVWFAYWKKFGIAKLTRAIVNRRTRW